MSYRHFDLELDDYQEEQGVERFRARVSASPAGEQRTDQAERVEFPAAIRQRLQRLDRRKLEKSEIEAVGAELGRALFPPGVLRLLENSLARLSEGDVLRIRLHIDSYALTNIPWEYAWLPRAAGDSKTGRFLALDRRLSLTRYEILDQAPGTTAPARPDALRMVTLLAGPAGQPPLKLDVEQANIEAALKQVPTIKPEFFLNATVEMLGDALEGGAHVFHFAGHGRFEAALGSTSKEDGTGYILLVDAQGNEVALSAERLAVSLQGRGVRLAVLGACEAGRRDQVNPWSGVAPALMAEAGVPAVVAMQYTIRDTNALTFCRKFYRVLAAGGTIDEAMTEGRIAIYEAGEDDERDWAVPVLYLRLAENEGALFPKPIPKPIPAPAPATPVSNGFGPLAYILCDRKFHVPEFKEHFQKQWKENSGVPLVYIVNGGMEDCHDSFIERLFHFRIKEVVEEGGRGRAKLKNLEWCYGDVRELPTLQSFLKRDLYEKLGIETDEDLSACEVGRRIAEPIRPARPVIVISQRIHIDQWDASTGPLLEWYLRYWAEIKDNSCGTQFVIFLALILPNPNKVPAWKRLFRQPAWDKPRRDKVIHDVLSTCNGVCCHTLRELTLVEKLDVEQWFRDHATTLYSDAERQEHAERIFRQKDGRLVDEQYMAHVEKQLKSLVDAHWNTPRGVER